VTGGASWTAGVPPAQTTETNSEHRGWRSRGYLPHLDAPELVQHVVFRLADSLPAHIRAEIGKIPQSNGSKRSMRRLIRDLAGKIWRIPKSPALWNLHYFDSMATDTRSSHGA